MVKEENMYGESGTNGGLHWVQRTKAFATTILPLVFDNSLSYLEMIGRFSVKLNECIDAINAQNLNLIEFCHMVEVEVDRFEKYIDGRITDFEDDIKQQWEDYKTDLNKQFADFKQQIETEWEQEKQLNETFRTELTAQFTAYKAEINGIIAAFKQQMINDFNTYKTEVNTRIETFENTVNADLTDFKTIMQTQQNQFESHMTSLFNDFTTDQSQAWATFQANFQTLFDQWKIDTLAVIRSELDGYETTVRNDLQTYIDGELSKFNQALTTAVSTLQNAVSNEALTRAQADTELQNQINQLTPEGSIKADAPDSSGNSQLYTVNPDTQERTDIFPVVQGDTGTGVKKLTMYPGANTYDYVAVSSSGSTYCSIHLSSTNTPEGVNDLGNIIKVNLDQINGSSTEAKMANFRAGTTLSTKLIADGDYTNTCINSMPTLAIHSVWTDNTYAYLSFKLKIGAALAASGAEEFFLFFSLLY